MNIKNSTFARGLISQGEFDQWVEANRPNSGNIIVKIFIHTRIIVTAAQLFPVVVAGLIREDSYTNTNYFYYSTLKNAKPISRLISNQLLQTPSTMNGKQNPLDRLPTVSFSGFTCLVLSIPKPLTRTWTILQNPNISNQSSRNTKTGCFEVCKQVFDWNRFLCEVGSSRLVIAPIQSLSLMKWDLVLLQSWLIISGISTILKDIF